VRTFIDGTASTDSFTGGGSKDPADLSSWKWSGSPTPNKDTFNSGYAAAYTAPNKDFELMFGADRVSPSGDANIGIWFFQNTVSLNANGSFNGVHKNGDIFVISAYTGGGSVPGIQVLKWDSTCSSGSSKATVGMCADSNLRLLVLQAASSSCAESAYCAATNSVTTAASWAQPNGIAANLFFQGGVDLSSALGNGTSLPCFSSFLEETRSSQSTSAVLKDFLLGGFPVCSISITKTCGTMTATIPGNGVPAPVLSADGTSVVYNWTGTVTNNGVGTLTGAFVNDTLPGGTAVSNPTLSSTTLAPGASATFTATVTLNALTATNTATAGAFFGTTEIDSTGAAAQAKCVINPSTSVSVVKHCVAPGPGLSCTSAGCVVQVPISAHVCNQGPVRLINIGLSDSPSATLSSSVISSLDPQGTVDKTTGAPTDCADVTGSYTPTGYDMTSDGATNGRYTFTDVISVNSATPSVTGAKVALASGCAGGALACAPVTCPICSNGECTTGALP
jgi:hypothetical protein